MHTNNKNLEIMNKKAIIDNLIMRLSYPLVASWGITLNKILVPIVNLLPGIALTSAVLLLVNFINGWLYETYKFTMSSSFTFLSFAILFILLGIKSIKKFNKKVVIGNLELARFELRGNGYVVNNHKISKRSERDGGVDFPEYAMVGEGERFLPWYINVSNIRVPDSSRAVQLTTGTIETASKNGVQIQCKFSERYHITNPGLYYNVAESNADDKLKKETLTNAVTDLIQQLDSSTLLWLSGKQIKKILLEPISYEKDDKTIINVRDEINNSTEDTYAKEKKLSGAQKVIQDFYQSKKMWIDLKVQQKVIGVKAEKKERQKLSYDFLKFKDAVVSSVGRIKHTNDRWGIFTDDIIQKEMNYASKEAQKAAEQLMIAQVQADADTVRIDWLNDVIEEQKRKWNDGSLSFKDILHAIQVEFGKRQGYSFDGNEKPKINLMMTTK